MPIEELRQELNRLLYAALWHSRARGDDRCWADDIFLWKQLPEGKALADTIPFPSTKEYEAYCQTFSKQARIGTTTAPKPPAPANQDLDLVPRDISGVELVQTIIVRRRHIRKLLSRPVRRRMQALYLAFYGEILPEELCDVDLQLPPEQEFLANCRNFCGSRPPCMTMADPKCHAW